MQLLKDIEIIRERLKSSSSKTKKTLSDSDIKQSIQDIEDFTQDLNPIKEIKNGVISLKNGGYITIAEFRPTNFEIRSMEDKNNIIDAYSALFKIPNFNDFQIKVVCKPGNSNRYANLYRKKLEKETDEKVLRYGQAYLDYILDLSRNSTVQRNYYIVIPYKGTSSDMEEIERDLADKLYAVRSSMHGSENIYIDHSVISESRMTEEELEIYRAFPEYTPQDIFLLNVFYEIFNPKTCNTESILDRYARLKQDHLALKGKTGKKINYRSTIEDLIAPKGFQCYSDFVVIDGTYQAYLYIHKKGYPGQMDSFAWGSKFVTTLDSYINVDIHISKADRNQMIREVNTKKGYVGASYMNKKEGDVDYAEVANAYESSGFILNQLYKKRDLFNFNIMFTVKGDTLEELKDKIKAIKVNLTQEDIIAKQVIFEVRDAFDMTLPINRYSINLFNKGQRNATTPNMANLSYLFTAYELNEEEGIILGVNDINGSRMVLDNFNRSMFANGNMAVIGTTGQGKTTTCQTLLARSRAVGTKCLIIAPVKGHEYMPLCEELGGTYINLSRASVHSINIMEIRKIDFAGKEDLDGADSANSPLLSRKINQIMIFLKLVFPMLQDDYVESVVSNAIRETYAELGITNDNSTLYKPGSDDFKEMPILGDVVKHFPSNNIMDRFRVLYKNFINNTGLVFNRPTNVNLDNDYVVIDLSESGENDKDFLPVAMFLATDYVMDEIRKDRTVKKFVLFDETWKLINSSTEAAEFVESIFRLIRAYNGCAIAASQQMTDFLSFRGGQYGKAILSNCKIKIVHNLEDIELKAINGTVIELSATEYKKIREFRPGHAMLITSAMTTPIDIRLSQYELELYGTNSAELEKRLLKKRAELSKVEIGK